MTRAYEATLDAFAVLYIHQKTETKTGRAHGLFRHESSGIPFVWKVRVDPDIVDGQIKNELVEKGDTAVISIQVGAPILNQDDQVRITSDETGNTEVFSYKVKGSADTRSGVTLDRKYRVVRI